MLINPVISASVSFGQETKKQNSFVLPFAVIGGVAGGLGAQFTQLKTSPDEVDTFIKTVDEKLPMSGQTRSSFFMLKDTINNARESAVKKLQTLGISKESNEISVNDLLSKVVQNDSKSLNGLNEDIKYIQGEISYLETQKDKAAEYLSKLNILEEKKAVKNLVEQAADGKIATAKLISAYESGIKNNPHIKSQLEVFSNLIRTYNKQKLICYPIIGLIIGGITGALASKPSKKTTA